jgi:hypothetical protein
MRVDAVNSYLSSMPIASHYPVAPIMRDGKLVELPEHVKTSATRFLFAYDTYGKAELRATPQAPKVQISEYEVAAILKTIESQKARKDNVMHWFPALLRV